MNNTSHSDNGEFWTIINGLNLLLVFIVTYFFVYMQTQGLITADTRQHIHFMQQYFEGQVYIPHPLWHIGTYYLSHLLGVDYSVGASVFTAFLVTFYAMVIYKIAQSLDTHKRDYAKWFLITFVSLVIGPFFLMSFNSRIYLGQGSPSVWHNVTLLT
ncbi:MAG TPA: hypothetical protein ENK77_03585, partial [Epsilonproteobacteria bacterium]|nr:hypothetical protein [Campylobacterota bacterium]